MDGPYKRTRSATGTNKQEVSEKDFDIQNLQTPKNKIKQAVNEKKNKNRTPSGQVLGVSVGDIRDYFQSRQELSKKAQNQSTVKNNSSVSGIYASPNMVITNKSKWEHAKYNVLKTSKEAFGSIEVHRTQSDPSLYCTPKAFEDQIDNILELWLMEDQIEQQLNNKTEGKQTSPLFGLQFAIEESDVEQQESEKDEEDESDENETDEDKKRECNKS